MAGELVSRILRSKTNLTDQEIEAMKDPEGWRLIYSLNPVKVQRPKKETICFTGFSPQTKESLHGTAAERGLHVVESVTTTLTYLCYGNNAGPVKMKKAKEINSILMTEDEFMEFIHTGVIPG